MDKDCDDEDDGIKAILIGDHGVGKTNLINTCAGLEFEDEKNPTISGSSIEKIININNSEYSVNLWDTAGQEAYRGVTKLFFRGSNIVILVYDITEHVTFESLELWVKECKELITEQFIFGVVGNKNDLFLEKKVSEEEGKTFAESLKCKHKLVSAKTDPQSFVDFLTELVSDFVKLDNRKGRKPIKLNNSIDNNNDSTGCGGWFSKLFKKNKKK
jgi:small GTP-binding protein